MRPALSLAVLPLISLSVAAPDGSPPSDEKPGYVWTPLTYRAENLPTLDIGLGSPKQVVRVALNTAYDRLLVNPVCSGKGNCPGPERTFQKEKSTSFHDLNEERTVSSFATITYGLGTDKLSIGSAEIDSQLFSVAKHWTLSKDYRRPHFTEGEDLMKAMPYGMLGVLHANASGPDGERASVVKSLIEGGHIRTQAFSVDIQDPGKDGSLIFGGVDVKKFSGHLEKREVMVSKLGREYIFMDEVAVSRPGKEKEVLLMGQTAISLQTSAVYSVLPNSMIDKLYKLYHDEHDIVSNHTLNCSFHDFSGTLDFKFGHATVQVPIKELVKKIEGYSICTFNIFPTPAYDVEGSNVLGADILKFAYVVYDQAHNCIHIGSSKNCGTEIKAVDGSTRVESLQGMC